MDRILIVDDEPSARKLLEVVLGNAGYEVIQASNGEEGCEKALKDPPDMVITDVLMPVKDGYQLAQELRSNPKTASLPIIMLTGLKEEHDELRAFQEGVDDFIVKPIRPSVLRARVTALLARAKAFHGENAVALPVKEEPATGPAVSGCQVLDDVLSGNLRPGTNLLVSGDTGSGKSRLARCLLAAGLRNKQRVMMITLDDEPAMIRQSLEALLCGPLSEFEEKGYFCLVDSFSWGRGNIGSKERFAVSGALELNQLAGVISDAGQELGQSLEVKGGGYRVFDSISSLFINFETASIQRFVSQLARTATSYGGVTTLFTVETGAAPEQALNNIKYVMDGLIETKFENGRYYMRVANMKWAKFSPDWVEMKEP